jgi:hypothetical protein
MLIIYTHENKLKYIVLEITAIQESLVHITNFGIFEEFDDSDQSTIKNTPFLVTKNILDIKFVGTYLIMTLFKENNSVVLKYQV